MIQLYYKTNEPNIPGRDDLLVCSDSNFFTADGTTTENDLTVFELTIDESVAFSKGLMTFKLEEDEIVKTLLVEKTKAEKAQLRFDKTARINKHQIDITKDHRTIDHKTELDVSLETKEVYGIDSSDRGLLKRKNYFFEDILYMFIEYDYRFNTIGEPSEQSIKLSWSNEDGTINSLNKDKGFVKLSANKRRKAVSKRRDSAIMLLEIQVMGMMTSNAANEAESSAAIDAGAALMSDVTLELDKFRNSGVTQPLVDKLTDLAANNVAYSFLNDEIEPGVTAITFISNFLNY